MKFTRDKPVILFRLGSRNTTVTMYDCTNQRNHLTEHNTDNATKSQSRTLVSWPEIQVHSLALTGRKRDWTYPNIIQKDWFSLSRLWKPSIHSAKRKRPAGILQWHTGRIIASHCKAKKNSYTPKWQSHSMYLSGRQRSNLWSIKSNYFLNFNSSWLKTIPSPIPILCSCDWPNYLKSSFTN